MNHTQEYNGKTIKTLNINGQWDDRCECGYLTSKISNDFESPNEKYITVRYKTCPKCGNKFQI